MKVPPKAGTEKSPERVYNEKNINKALLLAQEAIADERNSRFIWYVDNRCQKY